MKKELLKETVNRLAMDCIELLEAYEQQESAVFRGYCHMYLPFLDKRYQVIHDLKRESIRSIGIHIKPYYEALIKETENLMGVLLTQEIEHVQHNSYLLLSLCYDISTRLFPFESVPFEKFCPVTPEEMNRRANQYIQCRFTCKQNLVHINNKKVISLHR